MPDPEKIKGGESFEIKAELPNGVVMAALRGSEIFFNPPPFSWGEDSLVTRRDLIQDVIIRVTGVQFVRKGDEILTIPWSCDFRPIVEEEEEK